MLPASQPHLYSWSSPHSKDLNCPLLPEPDPPVKVQFKCHQVLVSPRLKQALLWAPPTQHFPFTSVLAYVTYNSWCSCLQMCLLALTTGKASFPKDGGGRYTLSHLLLLSAQHRVNSQCIIDEMNFPLQNNPVISWTLGPLLSMSGSQSHLVLWVVPIVMFGPLRNDGNGRMGTRQSLTWGERNDSVISHTHEEQSEWKGGGKNKQKKNKPNFESS